MKTTSLFMNLLTSLLFSAVVVQADPASLPFTDCFSGDEARKLTVSTVYGQVVRGIDGQSKTGLNVTIFGENPQEIVGSSSSSLSTLFTATTVLTLGVFSNATWFCNPLRPPNAQPLPAENASYCPLAAGPFAFGSPVIWGENRDLTTLTTRLRAVDESSNELICLDVSATPLQPTESSPYGEAVAIFWMTVGLALAYWLVVGIARIASAWNRGVKRPDKGIWSRAQSAGFILASAISGERLATSPALLRFCTPSLRDIFFHTQWCAVLAMVAVEWPQFVYPLLTQTAWSTLTYNITVTSSGAHWDPLSTQPFNPPASFAAQTSDPSSPLYIDPTIPNVLFTLPTNASHGMESFAYSVGVRPQDLFSICLVLFLGIIGGTIVISFFVWLIDYIALFFVRMVAKHGPGHPRLAGARSPGYASKDLLDTSSPVPMTGQNLEDNKSLTGQGNGLFSPPSRFGLSTTSGKGFWRSHFHIRKDINSFHGSVLQGNLVRVLVIFHLPITIFSCYQMTLRHTRPDIPTPMSSVILAALAFAFLSLLIPAFLVVRVTMTTTNKLYDETRTLLSLGPLYNHYRHGSQMFASLLFASNIAFGVAIGCGQNSGTAQAIVILVIEVVSALVTSIWLPWGTGASMGLISFLFCVARIVVAVLLVILTPTISIGRGPGAWVSYGILVILALVYLALVTMLLVKLLEATIRIFGRIPFDRSTHVVDSGLLGACGLLGCCGPRRRRRRRPRRNRYKAAESARSEGAPSERSSYMPPNVLGARDDGIGSRKGSVHSGQPPSVLKPEQALRPYKEDSDDENGYIMGAWQPSPRPGYSTLRDTPSPVVNKPSGFSRVGGGRAHIDSPYAITASGSTHTFPSSSSPQNAAGGSALPVFDDDDSPPPSLSNVARYQDHALPPGAMQPISHIRTKSQTAIIEDASALVLTVPSSSKNGMDDDDDEDSDTAQPKKKPWYHLRRHRPHSSDGTPSRDPPPDEESAPDPLSSQTTPGRSFVVIRKPQSSPHRLNALASGSAPSSGPNTPNVGSFGQNSANTRAHNATA